MHSCTGERWKTEKQNSLIMAENRTNGHDRITLTHGNVDWCIRIKIWLKMCPKTS